MLKYECYVKKEKANNKKVLNIDQKARKMKAQ